MTEEKPSSEAPKEETADADTSAEGSPPPAENPVPPPKPESSSPTPDPPPPPATGPAPETLAAPNSSTQIAAVAVPDCRSFSQLLAGAMASPTGSPRTDAPILAVPIDAVRLPVVAVPCFIAPAALLESPPFTFAMTHQAVLATVTAQAQMQLQAANSPASSSDVLPSSFPQPILSAISPMPLQQLPPFHDDSICTPKAEQLQPSDQKHQSAHIATKMNPNDGYNWRKYGQKQVKSSENTRSYYKCTSASCSAKKKVERCPDGRVTEVMYRGQHNHDPPQQTRYSRERVVRASGLLGEIENSDPPSSEINEPDLSTCKTEQNSGNETPEQQLFCSSDCEGDAVIKSEHDIGDEPDPKRRLTESTVPYSTPPIKTFREPRVVVQSASDVGHVTDGYRWRKYGQKIVKGNPNPRSYYRCTHNGCPVRKHVERASNDAKAIVITYEGKHNHDLPGSKNSSDPPASSLIASQAAVTPGEQLKSSDSSLDKKPSTELPTDADGKSTGEKALELGGDKALESAQALLSIGCNSTAGEDAGGADSKGMKRPLFNENPATVPVQNS